MTLSEAVYDAGKSAAWSASVTEAVVKGLAALARPYKFVVACVLVQRAGGGLHAAAAALWDAKKDGVCSMAWENASMHCIVTVAGLALTPSAASEV